MSRVLIIGYGNPLRGDDGFGWRVVEELQGTLRGGQVELIACHQLTPELAEPVSQARYVIFVDAARETVPGKLTLSEVRMPGGAARFSHYLTPGRVVEYADKLFGRHPRRVYLLTVGAGNLEVGDTLSEEVARMVPLAKEQIARLCAMMRDAAGRKVSDGDAWSLRTKTDMRV